MIKTHSEPLLITLDQIMSDYNGRLLDCLDAHQGVSDVLIYWQVDIDVRVSGWQRFFVCVAVCWSSLSIIEAEELFVQLADDDAVMFLAYIPAFHFGSKDFDIFIAETDYGENLVSGLINEVIQQSDIEQTLYTLCHKRSPSHSP